jgi:hypothetical protein
MTDTIPFPTIRAKRNSIEPSEPGTNLAEIGTNESWEGIGINMLCAGMLFLLERYGPERTLELIAHSYAETRKKHLQVKATN